MATTAELGNGEVTVILYEFRAPNIRDDFGRLVSRRVVVASSDEGVRSSLIVSSHFDDGEGQN